MLLSHVFWQPWWEGTKNGTYYCIYLYTGLIYFQQLLVSLHNCDAGALQLTAENFDKTIGELIAASLVVWTIPRLLWYAFHHAFERTGNWCQKDWVITVLLYLNSSENSPCVCGRRSSCLDELAIGLEAVCRYHPIAVVAYRYPFSSYSRRTFCSVEIYHCWENSPSLSHPSPQTYPRSEASALFSTLFVLSV